MSCPCDQFERPLPRIAAGLSRLPRQDGTFPDYRSALLHGASVPNVTHLEADPFWAQRFLQERDRGGLAAALSALSRWRGRHPQDFGIMLCELWAYVCDVLSFYDEVLANESFVRTAVRGESVRRLLSLLGYVPRPAVAALVELSTFATGRQAVALPAGTAFRSGAFDGHPPQVFETMHDAAIHPLLNEWSLQPVRPGPPAATLQSEFLCRLGSVRVKAGGLVRLSGSESTRRGSSPTCVTRMAATASVIPN